MCRFVFGASLIRVNQERKIQDVHGTTSIPRLVGRGRLHAPLASPGSTVRIGTEKGRPPQLTQHHTEKIKADELHQTMECDGHFATETRLRIDHTQDKDKFQVILDVQQFAPTEIVVKTSGNSLIVEGKHEEKQDEHGFISRHFVRRYLLPESHDVENVVSSLSSDGILTVSAPKKGEKPVGGERVVPITKTGPAKATVQPSETQPTVEHPTS
ncbi:hypothetical protein JTB14_005415 [Gonioctena quinquepunctata]|nr:hypothetical protein JTB14_005415 [Gonioctena quinquepunctata]